MKRVYTLGLLAVTAAVSLSAPLVAEAREAGRANFSAMDIDGSGEVTQEEMRAFRDARLMDMDTDGDGALSRAELLAAEMDPERAEARVDRMLSRADANDNGLIEFSEMGGRGDRSARMFDRLDADGSGGLSPEELAKARGRRGG